MLGNYFKRKIEKEKIKIKVASRITNTLLLIILLSISAQATAQQYIQTNLVSDVPGLAKLTDPNLVNPWGLSHSSTGPWWVSDNGIGVATVYNGTGVPFPYPSVVTIPATGGSSTPTGNVFNGGNSFNVTPGNPARFIFVTEDGTIAAWNPNVDPIDAILMANNSPEAVYKGVTIGKMGDKDILYVANFREGSVDLFDTNFNKVILDKKAFADKKIPTGFAPFNVQNIEGKIYVSFAKQNSEKHDDVAGPGLGYVDVFDTSGNLLMRLKHGFWLNSPWAIVLAPSSFGKFSNDILIGNFGSGKIAAFDTKHGNFHGLLKGPKGKPIVIEGLWGLGFGNGADAGPTNTLFFAAGIKDEAHGLFGTIVSSK